MPSAAGYGALVDAEEKRRWFPVLVWGIPAALLTYLLWRWIFFHPPWLPKVAEPKADAPIRAPR
ncbi:MAG TPA: hypothetical protein RMH85_12205 [Polyangiaceae bacterium LLY-WYZ-15_(1-7)]|nr:hypothetical protein [Sandaracinus sp.]HJK91351.1 hypothetical protein [Polyangiaceae bacterium LLY-WYZ-15_(1-7)]HJL04493.1 hypothetical protein [Polyangiaceae bacterium LLY-WYZ-15_(1-7)]HJL09258.1 hypothetical protein [Polyangiaceae bacterium LLY-WYZ-15_(1-7)]HJL22772.1 hypothetical protein [Polyangiaceae bacterium LLY-WYZ-15_(1-7)]